MCVDEFLNSSLFLFLFSSLILQHTAKHYFTRHYKKLKREDFPDGGYLRIRHAHYLKHQRHSRLIGNEIYDNTHNGIEIISSDSDRDNHNSRYRFGSDDSNDLNDILFDDLEPEGFHHRTHESSHRGKRDATKELPIDYCCSQATRDICNRYSCH